jgi:hypothetical protein
VPVVSPLAANRDVVVALREQLERERAAGAYFDSAWSRSVEHVLQDVGERQAEQWRIALVQTRIAWARAYRGEAVRGGEALDALSAF